MRQSLGRLRLFMPLAVTVAIILWGAWKWSEVRRYRRAIAEIEDEIESGLPALAAPIL